MRIELLDTFPPELDAVADGATRLTGSGDADVGASLGKRSRVEYKESPGGVPHRYPTVCRRRLGAGVAARLRRGSRAA